MLDWGSFYRKYSDKRSLNEIITDYNRYVYENEVQMNMEFIRKLGNGSSFLIQENGYLIEQETYVRYGILIE